MAWGGERGVPPFTRMSIFDSPAVSTHVDDDLDYVYTRASLALFNGTSAAQSRAVTSEVDAAISALGTGWFWFTLEIPTRFVYLPR